MSQRRECNVEYEIIEAQGGALPTADRSLCSTAQPWPGSTALSRSSRAD